MNAPAFKAMLLRMKILTVVLFGSVVGVIIGPFAQEPGSPSNGMPSSSVQPLPVSSSSSFAEDAMQLCALLEGWSGTNIAESEERLCRDYLSHLLAGLDLPPSRVAVLAVEFKRQIVDAFRTHAANVFRERFSHQELSELLAFYKTPLGRKYAAAYPELIAKMSQGDLSRRILRNDILRRIRSKYPDVH